MSLVTLGSAAYDTVESPFGSRVRALGGSGVYASFAASFFTQSRLVAVVGEDWNPEYSELLRSHGVDLTGLEIRKGERTTSWHGRYPVDMNCCQTLDIQLNVMFGYRPTAPEPWKSAPCVLLGNGAPEADMSLLDSMDRPKLVVADTKLVEISETSAEKVLYVGDRLENDIIPAKKAGLGVAWIEYTPSFQYIKYIPTPWQDQFFESYRKIGGYNLIKGQRMDVHKFANL